MINIVEFSLISPLKYLYDIIVHNLFKLEGNIDSGWYVELYPPKNYKEITNQLNDFTKNRGLTDPEEKWITASLFFSMLPIHSDNIQRQRTLTIIGCCIVHEAFSLVIR